MVRRQFVRGIQVVRALLLASAGIAAVAPAVIALAGQDDAVGVQAVRSPPRDRGRPVRAGTGAIKGVVVDGQTGQPIARARVRLFGMIGVRAGITGSDGAFSFMELPPGEFALQVEKSTFLPSRYPDGTRSLRASQRGASLSDGEVIDLVIALHRGGSIAGRVFDAHGDLVEGARVSAFRARGTAARAIKFSEVRTDDLGEFRVARLRPGTYFLMVAAPRVHQPDVREASDTSLEPVPTYYPSATSLEMAHHVDIGDGQSLTGIDVVLAEAMTAVVDGLVVRRDGAPAGNGFVNAWLLGSHHLMGSVDATGAQIRPDGTFRMTLPPGEYRLHALVTELGEPGSRPTEQTGHARLSVGGSGVENVAIVVGGPATASGRIIFEGTPPPRPPGGMSLPHLPLESVEEGDCRSGQLQVDADWSFTLDGLSGTCAAPPMLSFGRWRVKLVLYRGRNLLERPLTLEPEQHLSGVQVVITDRQSGMLFRVSDENGQETREYVALVFPTDKSRWRPDGRFVRVYAPLPQTLFERLNPALAAGDPRGNGIVLDPGDYFAVALEDIHVDAVHDLSLLERLIPVATRVVLTEGARQEVALRRVSLSDMK